MWWGGWGGGGGGGCEWEGVGDWGVGGGGVEVVGGVWDDRRNGAVCGWVGGGGGGEGEFGRGVAMEEVANVCVVEWSEGPFGSR